MLQNRETGKWIESLPLRAVQELKKVCRKIGGEHLPAIERQIKQWAEDTRTSTDFFASSWKAGGDWSTLANGVFLPLFNACCQEPDRAERMLSWLILSVMMRRDEEWGISTSRDAEVAGSFWGARYWRREPLLFHQIHPAELESQGPCHGPPLIVPAIGWSPAPVSSIREQAA
jgi:hypothetical protein